jgi:hypothetical protein
VSMDLLVRDFLAQQRALVAYAQSLATLRFFSFSANLCWGAGQPVCREARSGTSRVAALRQTQERLRRSLVVKDSLIQKTRTPLGEWRERLMPEALAIVLGLDLRTASQLHRGKRRWCEGDRARDAAHLQSVLEVPATK